MQKFKFLFTLIVVGINLIVAVANNATPGFAISNSGDTIQGKVLNINQKSIYNTCSFETQNGVQVFKPNEIKGFGIKSQFFTSQVVDSSFVEVLMEGTISLYKQEDIFWVTKNGELFILQSKEKKVTTGSSSFVIESNKWKGALSFLISDCMSNAQQRTARMSFNEKQIINVIRQYNQCKGEVITEYKENEKWNTVRFGLYGSYTFSSIKFNTNPESIKSDYPGIGLVVELSSPRISKNFSLQFEPHYAISKYRYARYEQASGYQYCDLYRVDLKTLSLPISVRQSIWNTKVDFYYQFGVYMDYHFNKKSVIQSKYTDGYEIFESDDIDFIEINSFQPGLLIGLGVMKNLDHFGFGLSFRYSNNFFISPLRNVNPYNDEFSINLIIMKR